MASDPAPGAVPAHVRRRRRTVLAAAFLGLAAAGAWSLVAPKVYVAEARLEATARRPAAEGAPDAVETLRARILSPETITRATGRDGSGAADPRDTATVTLATQVEVESGSGPGATLRVTHAASDPELALRTLQGLLEQFRADLYEAPRQRQEATVADARRSWEEADAAAVAAEQARDAHREANRDYLDDLDAQITAVRREIEEVEQGDVLRLGEKMQEAEQVLAVEPQYRREEIREIDQVALAAVENEMQRHRALVKDLQENKHFTDSHLEVKEAKAALVVLEARKKEIESKFTVRAAMVQNPVWAAYAAQRDEANSALLVARKRIESLRRNEKRLQELVRQSPPVREQAERLAAAADAARAGADVRKATLGEQETRLAGIEDERPFDVRVVAAPARPETPRGPAPAVLAAGGIAAGALLGLLAALVLSARDPTFRAASAVAPALGIPELGAIDFFHTQDEAAEAKRRAGRATAVLVVLGLAAACVAGAAVSAGATAGAASASEEAPR